MKGLCLFLLAALSVSLFAETVVKISAPFAFPTAVGVTAGQSSLDGAASFICKPHFGGKNAVLFSWSLPLASGKGTISIFTVRGTKIRSFAVTTHQGSMQWDVSKEGRLANGTYLASLSYGIYTRTSKIILYR